MKQASTPKGKPRFRLKLEHAAVFFVVAAVLFFGYSVFQASTGSGSSSGGGVSGLNTHHHSGGLNRRTLVRVGAEEGGDGDGGDGTHVEVAKPCPKAEPVVKTETVTVTKLVYGSTLQNPRAYHVVTTVAGFSNHWQARIHYYWFKKQRDACLREPACDMGGFTRVLHTGKPDDLMDEIPTVVVDPLPDRNTTYIVLNRPYAFMQWMKMVSIPEKYFVMCEADHLFMRPLPNFMNGEAAGAALFTYIVPWNYNDIVKKFIGKDKSDEEVKKVPQIGNSPTFISTEEFKVLAPIWYNTTMEIFDDKEAHDAWNWVLEMYGYAIATYRAGQHVNMRVVPNMLAHPPFDKEEVDPEGRPFYLLHLTYPCRYDKFGNMTDNSTLAVWTFDKREYSVKPPPRNLAMPPEVVHNNLVRLIVGMINEATDALPCWDDYVATSKVNKCGHHTAQTGAKAEEAAAIAGGATKAAT
ncbi:hypothetical protein HYH02_012825 [Chlamydomonas schloesseri]|uniref:Hydroxyproline O-arabinosyltransferase-like domain-containing protein n=1 Tax=Chlamydomonas schloesseri TaxID=2026947 RepID=A0A835W0W9_9CHLO|nr:hypothetical protein HYH02_012825 [Chlamydomonas schloesseri]|eukprot:KAG2433123.1 hypothetical protein HYH02_012825 [Chlamydomonas schloesseri]